MMMTSKAPGRPAVADRPSGAAAACVEQRVSQTLSELRGLCPKPSELDRLLGTWNLTLTLAWSFHGRMSRLMQELAAGLDALEPDSSSRLRSLIDAASADIERLTALYGADSDGSEGD